MRQSFMTGDEIRAILSGIRNRKILVVGDVMVDEYVWGRIDRISPEAPIPVVDVQSEEALMGGAANVVANLVGLGAKVRLAGVIGRDEKGDYLKERLRDENVVIQGLLVDKGRPTSTKTRILGRNQQLLRIDREDRIPVSGATEDRLIRYLLGRIPSSDGVILSDYGKGVLTDRVISETVKAGRKAGKIVIVDPKGQDFSRYRGVTCITPNRKEAEGAWGKPIRSAADIRSAARHLRQALRSQACLITLGKEGMALLDRKEWSTLPTAAQEVFDVTGAGDTVIAVFTLVASAGYGLKEAAAVANMAAGIVVGKVGAARATPSEILEFSREGQDGGSRKVLMPQDLQEKTARLQKEGRSVVFTNGCFDLLHVGHIQYLQEARRLGDCLVIGLNSDTSVRRLKGKERPLISEGERAQILSALDCVDYVVIFGEATPVKLIRRIRPDVLVKGGDYRKKDVVGGDLVESYGGKVRLVPVVRGRSTSEIVRRIVDRYGEGH